MKFRMFISAIAALFFAVGSTNVVSADLVRGGDYLEARNLFTDDIGGGFASIFQGLPFNQITAIGDTYTLEPLVQDSGGAFFASDVADPTHTFDGVGEAHGNNLVNPPSTWVVDEMETDMGGGMLLIQTEITSIDALGAATPWVAAGQVGPNSPWLDWRLDVGDFAAGANKINTDLPFTVVSSGFSIFDSAGTSLATFALTADSSDGVGVSGVGVVGLNGADIAGFDVARIQMFWTVQSIPEPASAGFVGLLLIGGCFTRRRSS